MPGSALQVRNQTTTGNVRIGTVHRTHEGRVDPDAAVAYALATNDPNEAYLRGAAVPPLYTSSLILGALHEAVEASVERWSLGERGSVHGEHDLRLFEPVRPGMHLRWRARTRNATQTPAGVLVTQSVLVCDLEDRPLVEHLWSTLYMGGHIECDLGDRPPDHTFHPQARQRPLGTYSTDMALDQGFRYAGASGDRVGHAISDEQARAEGFHGKILQGLCTFAMCSGGVVAHAAGGDPSRLRRLAGRFASPTYPKQRLDVELYDAGRRSDGTRLVAFEAIAGGVAVVKHGLAEISPA